MKLIYTEHALRRMAKRQLREEWIECVAAHPLRIGEFDAGTPAGGAAGVCQPGVAGYCIQR